MLSDSDVLALRTERAYLRNSVLQQSLRRNEMWRRREGKRLPYLELLLLVRELDSDRTDRVFTSGESVEKLLVHDVAAEQKRTVKRGISLGQAWLAHLRDCLDENALLRRDLRYI
jgi:hypothetical protein